MTLVQVVFSKYHDDKWSARAYTYEDPTGELQVGDLVYVMAGSIFGGSSEELAKVVAIGSDYEGPVKKVLSRA